MAEAITEVIMKPSVYPETHLGHGRGIVPEGLPKAEYGLPEETIKVGEIVDTPTISIKFSGLPYSNVAEIFLGDSSVWIGKKALRDVIKFLQRIDKVLE